MHEDERSAETAARSPELCALLRDLDALRLSLATDLSLAAAALEAGSPELAGAVVDSDRAELEHFRQRALHHLATAEQAPVPAPRRRRSLMTAVTPLLATAAAVLGVMAGLVPTAGPQPTASAGTGTAMASYQQVTQLSLEGAEAEEIARAAERLHEELAAILATASSDPAAAHQALALLESETRVLDRSADREQLSGVIAEAHDLLARLRAALPAPVRPPRLPVPTTAPVDVVLPVQVPSALLPPEPPSPRPEPSPEAEQSPSAEPPPPSPSPSAAPTPASSPTPSTAPAPAPAPSSSPSPAPAPAGADSVLPGAVQPTE